ncbi:hypothetical protein EYF80_005838 [Liparis tanakae]|uniref:Uncharacterized protein n=1 Tax=Liparis tanakae TaxID=230148 RepID=A0A4Z2J1S5_9TELE|nr:hypothetical protein EYF80_005838 [Liparis tanakae]
MAPESSSSSGRATELFRRVRRGSLTAQALDISGSNSGGRGVDRMPLYLPQGLASSKQGYCLTPICNGDSGIHTHTHKSLQTVVSSLYLVLYPVFYWFTLRTWLLVRE